ncbi:MAG TPA: hypothetical protein VL240_01870 [Candidatus Binatia bacterium]|nr:hypothetical protein [Candidatus Binatia bacterium]
MPIASLPSRIGAPQLIALLLLVLFGLQCVWFIGHEPLSAVEGMYVEAGLLHLERYAGANTPQRTALVALVAGVTARVCGLETRITELNRYRLLIRLPFLIAGLLLGASLWYVARRLYGNIGGYVALGLYCFSPLTIEAACEVGPSVIGAWGAFGLIFTSIAVAHTLYAPREVVLWNWRRILLMGLSIAICVGAQFSFWVLLVPALLFMLWVGHVRPLAALAIFAAACLTGLILISALYGFRPGAVVRAFAAADWLEIASRDFVSPGMSWALSSFFLENGLGLLILVAVTLVTFVVWKRTRFFGTAAPLLVTLLLFSLALRMHFSASTFLFVALPFLMLFMAGVSADLLESRYALAANAVVFGVLIANAMIDVYGLLALGSRSR